MNSWLRSTILYIARSATVWLKLCTVGMHNILSMVNKAAFPHNQRRGTITDLGRKEHNKSLLLCSASIWRYLKKSIHMPYVCVSFAFHTLQPRKCYIHLCSISLWYVVVSATYIRIYIVSRWYNECECEYEDIMISNSKHMNEAIYTTVHYYCSKYAAMVLTLI